MIAPAPMIHLRSVTKRFGGVVAVDDVSLQVRPGEFLTLLGPSGCGKTTLLRLIAGFDSPDAGEVHIAGADVTHTPPYRRNVNQVFQSYALFPHLSVHDNVAFGLRMQRVPRAEIARRVEEALAQVELGGLGGRRPHQLSGGQRQRVALARALVPQPQVLLLDEPLSALDAKLRRAMQTELKQLQRRVGLTFVFVTHDQEEALTMSDRIAVLNRGRIEQLGTADEIYAKPRTAFVADFIGEANLLEAELVAAAVPAAPADAAAGGGACGSVRLAGGLELAMTLRDWPESTQRALVSIRPEKVLVSKARPEAENVFRARVAEEVFRGAMDELVLETDAGTRLRAVVANESALLEAIHEGDQVWCGLHADDLVVVKAE